MMITLNITTAKTICPYLPMAKQQFSLQKTKTIFYGFEQEHEKRIKLRGFDLFLATKFMLTPLKACLLYTSDAADE